MVGLGELVEKGGRGGGKEGGFFTIHRSNSRKSSSAKEIFKFNPDARAVKQDESLRRWERTTTTRDDGGERGEGEGE